MLSTLSCRDNGQNGVTLLGWIYLVNLFWVSHHAYYHFDVEQLIFPLITIQSIQMELANSANLEPVKLLYNNEGLHFGMSLLYIYFSLNSSHFCYHIQFLKPIVILQLNLWKMDQSHNILQKRKLFFLTFWMWFDIAVGSSRQQVSDSLIYCCKSFKTRYSFLLYCHWNCHFVGTHLSL